MGIPDSFGAALIGSFISAMLYGITTLQTYVYYMHYSEDSSTMKFIVAATWILDTLHVSLVCHAMYHYLIAGWGVLTSLEYIVWSSAASVLVNSFVVAIVQSFFAHQIYHLCRPQLRWLALGSIVFLVLACFGSSMWTAISYLVNDDVDIPSIVFHAEILSQATAALCEVLITTLLCVLLYDKGSGSALPRTKSLLNTLIVYAVNRCLLTLLVVIGALAAIIDNQNSWLMGLSSISGKLYANSLLASLNTRQYLRSRGSGPESDVRINSVHFATPSKLSGDIEDSNGVIDISAIPALDKTATL